MNGNPQDTFATVEASTPLPQCRSASVDGKPRDAELLKQLTGSADATQRNDALSVLMERYSRLVYTVCLRTLNGHATLADEAVQDVFIRLYRHAYTIRKSGSLVSWLSRTACRVALNTRREQRRRHERERRASDFLNDLREDAHYRSKEASELMSYVMQAIAALPSALREIAVLHFVEGSSQSAIARSIGCSPEAIQKRVARAKNRIVRHVVRQRVGTSDAVVVPLLATLAISEGRADLRSAAAHIRATVLGIAARSMPLPRWPVLCMSRCGVTVLVGCVTVTVGVVLTVRHLTSPPRLSKHTNPSPTNAAYPASAEDVFAVQWKDGDTVFREDFSNGLARWTVVGGPSSAPPRGGMAEIVVHQSVIASNPALVLRPDRGVPATIRCSECIGEASFSLEFRYTLFGDTENGAMMWTCLDLPRNCWHATTLSMDETIDDSLDRGRWRRVRIEIHRLSPANTTAMRWFQDDAEVGRYVIFGEWTTVQFEVRKGIYAIDDVLVRKLNASHPPR